MFFVPFTNNAQVTSEDQAAFWKTLVNLSAIRTPTFDIDFC